jgi:hypothetical protein
MSSTQQVFAAGPPVSFQGSRWPRGYSRLHGADLRWAIAFVLPYAAVFFVFVVYPFGYALWMAGRPVFYAELIADRSYLTAVVNTLLFVGIGAGVGSVKGPSLRRTGTSEMRRLRPFAGRAEPTWSPRQR